MKHFKLIPAFIVAFLIGLPVIASAQPVPPDCRQGPNIRCDIPHCSKFCHGGPHHHDGPRPHHGHAAPPPPPPRPVAPPPPPPRPHAHHVPPPPPRPVPPPPPVVVAVPAPPPPPVVVAPSPAQLAMERELRDRRDDDARMRRDLDDARERADHEYHKCMRVMYPFNGGCTRVTPEVKSLEHRIDDNDREIRRLEHALGIR